MSDPTRYQPGYSFTGYQTVHPTEPLPAVELDNELAGVGRSIEEVVDALADIRRSDGKLMNGSVAIDSLHPATKAALVAASSNEADRAEAAAQRAEAAQASIDEISAEIVTVAGIAPAVATVAWISDAVTSVALNRTAINIVAQNMDAIAAAPSAAESARLSAEEAARYAEAAASLTIPDGSVALQKLTPELRAYFEDMERRIDEAAPVGSEKDYTGIAAPPGWLIENGLLIPRIDIPRLTQFAFASGNIVEEDVWHNEQMYGAFSYGPGGVDGEFLRIPDTRGLFVRALGAGRTLGEVQPSQNLAHDHAGAVSEIPDHVHAGWTDVQGWHDHWVTGRREGGGFGLTVTAGHQGNPMIWADGQTTSGNGNHGHSVGIGAAGRHTPTVSIAQSGGSEARPVNVARLKILKY